MIVDCFVQKPNVMLDYLLWGHFKVALNRSTHKKKILKKKVATVAQHVKKRVTSVAAKENARHIRLLYAENGNGNARSRILI